MMRLSHLRKRDRVWNKENFFCYLLVSIPDAGVLNNITWAEGQQLTSQQLLTARSEEEEVSGSEPFKLAKSR